MRLNATETWSKIKTESILLAACKLIDFSGRVNGIRLSEETVYVE